MSHIDKWLTRFMSLLVGATLIILTIVVLLTVISRFVFNLPIPWSLDAIRISFIYMIFIAMPILVRTNEHINIDVLFTILPKKAKKIFEAISLVFVLLFSIVFFYSGWIFTLASQTQYMPYLHIKMSYVYLILPVSSLLVVVYSIFSIVKLLRSNHDKDSA